MVDLQNRVLLHDAEQQQHPKPEKTLMVCPAISSERIPKGTAKGSVSRIVNGCRKDSNCAASTMYMKMSVSDIATTK